MYTVQNIETNFRLCAVEAIALTDNFYSRGSKWRLRVGIEIVYVGNEMVG
jgi:hypothetical protein